MLVKLNLPQLAALATQFSNVIPVKPVQPEKFTLPLIVCRAEKTAVPSSPVQPEKFMDPLPLRVESAGNEGAPVRPVSPLKLIE
jgi:hypothetical protein